MDSTSQPQITRSPFPAPNKSASTTISDTAYTATLLTFTDKLLLTLVPSLPPHNNPTHWLHVPLSTSANPLDPSFAAPRNAAAADPNALLPRTDLTATTVLGGTKAGEEVVGQTLAATVASAVLHRRPGEERMLVLGLGLGRAWAGLEGEGEEERGEWFGEVVGLCLEVLG